MSEIAPWLVVGGAAIVVLCAAATLTAVGRALRRRRAPASDTRHARSALESGSAGGFTDDELMPLLLAAAIEATGADAAVVTLLRTGDRRRSYSANLDLRAARAALSGLVAAGTSAQAAADGPRDYLVFPVERDDLSAVLAVYWHDEVPDGGPRLEPRLATDVEELIAAAFRRLPARDADEAPGAPPKPEAPRDEDERMRWTRLAALNGTLEPAPLLEKIVDATLTDCGADAAAARISAFPQPEHLSAASRFAAHEARWVESVLGSRTLATSVTRFFVPAGDADATAEAPIATAIVAPLRGAGDDVVGSLVAAWRRDLADDADDAVGRIEMLVEDARVALANATRFQHLQAAAVRAPSTGPFDEPYFVERLAEAVNEAERTGRPLVVAALAASELEAVDDVHLAALEDALLVASARIANTVGDQGIACRIGLAEFAAIIPGADSAVVEPRIDALVRDLPDRVAGEGRLKWTASLVQLDSPELPDELWKRARRGLHTPAPTPVPTAGRPSASPVVSGPMRLSYGERGDDWTLRRPAPGKDEPN
jgi:GGDEF domain-containing protein